MTPDELEKVYQETQKGTEHPRMILFYCIICEKEFIFAQDSKISDYCEHVQAIFKKERKI